MASDSGRSRGITTIVPVYNGARYIGETIESLLAQSLRPEQIIVVDDGSTDGSGEHAQTAGMGLVQVIRQANQGINGARETGLKAATADYVHFLDSDDLCPPGALAHLHAALEQQPDWSAVFGTWRNFWIEELAHEEQLPEAEHLRGEQRSSTLCAGLFRRDWIQGFKPVRGDSWHAAVLWIAEAQRAGVTFGRIDAHTLERRIHHSNYSRRKKPEDLVNLALSLHRSARDQRRARKADAEGDVPE